MSFVYCGIVNRRLAVDIKEEILCRRIPHRGDVAPAIFWQCECTSQTVCTALAQDTTVKANEWRIGLQAEFGLRGLGNRIAE